MKYLLILLLMSGYVSADIENEIKLANALGESNEFIAKLIDQNERLMEQSAKSMKQANGFKGYIQMITDDCIKGLGFAGMGSDGVMYRLNCSFNKAVK